MKRVPEASFRLLAWPRLAWRPLASPWPSFGHPRPPLGRPRPPMATLWTPKPPFGKRSKSQKATKGNGWVSHRRPILKGRVNPSPPLRQNRRSAPASPFGLRAWPKRRRLSRSSGLGFLASPGLPLASPSWPFRGLSWPPWPPLASLGLVWLAKADLGLAWPALAAAGFPTLRSYWQGRCFVRVGLPRSKFEKGGRQGPQGSPWPGLWHPLGPL